MNIIINLFKKTITKVILLTIVLLAILSIFLFWGWYGKQYNKIWGYYYVHKGDKAYKTAKYQKAIDYYQLGLKHYPEHSKAQCNLGNIYVAFENYYAAVDAYENALKHDPDFIMCRMDLGIILSEKLANYDQAIQEYGRVAEAHPFLIHLPFIYNNTKSVKYNKGLAFYNMGLAYRGKSLYMGQKTLASTEYLVKSKEAYEKAKKILKKDYDTHYNLALTNQLLGEFKDAGLEYCRAIELSPFSYEAHYNLGILLRTMKRYKDALIEFEKAGLILDMNGDTGKTKYLYGVMNELKQKIINSRGGYQYIIKRSDSLATDEKNLRYKNGKVYIGDDTDNSMHKILKQCPSKEYFKEM